MKYSTDQKVKPNLLTQGGSVGLAAAVDLFILSKVGIVSQATVSWYQAHLHPLIEYFGDMEIERISLDDLRQYRATVVGYDVRWSNHPKMKPKEGGLSPETIFAKVRAVRTFFKWLTDEGLLDQNPAARLDLPPRPKRIRKGIKDEDRLAIIASIITAGPHWPTWLKPRNLAMVCFLDDTACRAAGVAGLKLSDLDLNMRRAYINEKGRGGNQKGRFVFFSPHTAERLSEWLDVRPGCDTKNVFIGRDLEPIQPKALYQVLKRAAKRAGVDDGWNPHNWRHGTIRRMKGKNINLATISQLAGHSTVTLTADLYGLFNENELQAAVDGVMWQVDPMDNLYFSDNQRAIRPPAAKPKAPIDEKTEPGAQSSTWPFLPDDDFNYLGFQLTTEQHQEDSRDDDQE